MGIPMLKIRRILTKVFLVTLAWVTSYGVDQLGVDAHTHTQKDRQMQATTIPESQNWPWVKTQQAQSNQ